MVPDARQRVVVSYALTLFILGAMVGLLAVLGRVGQEVLSGVFRDMRRGFVQPTPLGSRPPLPAMIHSLDSPSDRLILLGFAVCAVCIVAGAYLWFAGGVPSAQRPPAWTLTGALIALLLAVGMGFALVCENAGLRMAALVTALVSGLALFVTFVMLVVRDTLRRT